LWRSGRISMTEPVATTPIDPRTKKNPRLDILLQTVVRPGGRPDAAPILREFESGWAVVVILLSPLFEVQCTTFQFLR
jgi:hypothetical protein